MLNTGQGLDINQLGASDAPRFSIFLPRAYLEAIVEDIIVNDEHELYAADGSNIGQAKIRMLETDKFVPAQSLQWANPIESNIQEYPLKNEIVMVFLSLGQLYYTRKIGILRKVTENSWKELSATIQQKSATTKTTNIRVASAQGALTSAEETSKNILGDKFVENPNVRSLKHFEGDVIVQGRFGNSMRFGSSLFSDNVQGIASPNIIMRIRGTAGPQSTNSSTGLVLENINDDASSFWMVENQIVNFVASTALSPRIYPAHLRSSTLKTSVYSGNQIFINSDRIVVNSKSNEISLFSNKEINLSAMEHITLDSENMILMTADYGMELSTNKHILFDAEEVGIYTKNFSIQSSRIELGSSAHPAVKGDELAVFLAKLIDALSTPFGITTSTGAGSFTPAIISKLKTLLQELNTTKPAIAVFNSNTVYLK